MPLESWRHALRSGVFAATRPDGSRYISDAALAALAGALRDDSPQLVQDCTVFTLPLPRGGDGPVPILGACLIGYCGWRGDGMTDACDVDDFFAEVCIAADRLLGGYDTVMDFLDWFDDTPRPEVLAALRVEVARERERRGAGLAAGGGGVLTAVGGGNECREDQEG